MSQPINPANLLRALRSYLNDLDKAGSGDVLLSDKALLSLKNLESITRWPSHAGEENGPATLEEIKQRLERVEGTPTLRDRMVFATGTPLSRLMFVGEAPGQEEEKQGEPFVGPAGKLLTRIIETMGMRRDEVYITNIVKFRPRVDGESQGTANRKPSPGEMRTFIPFLADEINVVKPELIIALGGTAMAGLLGIESSVSSARGTLHKFKDCPVIVTYHPSFLLRSGSNSDKRKLWEDMLFAMEHLKMPISEKQRNYFRS